MRGIRWVLVASLGLITTGCYVEQRRPPRQGPPAMVSPIGPEPARGQGPVGPPVGAHAFQGAAPTAVGAIPPGAVKGRPRGMHPGAPPAMWIWLNLHGRWRVRTTSAGQRRNFGGVVMGATAQIHQVEPSRNEFRDGMKLNQGSLRYDFTTAGHIDGFDFRVSDDGCARFVIDPMSPTEPYRIFVGRDSLSPPPGEFTLCP